MSSLSHCHVQTLICRNENVFISVLLEHSEAVPASKSQCLGGAGRMRLEIILSYQANSKAASVI